MALVVPPSLKQANIPRFAARATQLEKANPVVAYWCNYWVIQQILSKSLHNADQDALAYTTALMDKLEKFKGENASNDAVVDDVVGKAVVEQFAYKIFNNAENAVKANKVSRQTADTYQAAYTFFELLEIWGAVEAEIQKKIVYSKYHAARIIKAIQAGEDPNLSNPKPEPEPEEAAPPLDPNDPEVQMLNGQGNTNRQPSVTEVPDEGETLQSRLAAQSTLDQSLHPSRDTSVPARPRQPSVVDAPDDHDKLQATLAKTSSRDESLHPSRVASGHVSPLGGDASAFYSGQAADVSPVSANERKSSVGGNYFPQMPPPTSTGEQPNFPPTLPSAPDTLDDGSGGLSLPSAPGIFASGPDLPETPSTFAQPHQQPRTPLDSFQPPPPSGPTTIAQPPPASFQIPPNQGPMPQYVNPSAPPVPTPQALVPNVPPPQPAQAPSQPAYTPASQSASTTNVVVDEEAMMKAQKHARWAISALNFEDVPTAIREFQAALQTLGAR